MRNKILLFTFALFAICGFNRVQAGGGPDAYGYVWLDSNDPGGPTFVWNSIVSAPGAVQISGLADDNSVGPFNLNGWTFRYYWTDISSWKFGSNGWVGLNNNIGNIAHCFPTMPQAGGSGDNFIAPFMTDLNFTSNTPASPNPGEVWYWDNGVDSLVIEWVNCPWWVQGTPDWIGSNSFQLILSAVDSSITMMYNDMDQVNFNDTQNCAADLEIGIENITGNIGIEVANETVPADQYAVKFKYPNPVLIQVPDVQPDWNANAENKASFHLVGDAVDMTTNIKNVGNASITNSIAVNGALRLGLNNFWTGSATLDSLSAGADQTVVFSNQAILTNADRYTFVVNTVNNQDLNPSNDENSVEFNVVACSDDTVNYNYGTGPADAAIAWAGGQGNEGGAVYIEPAAYPCVIEAIDVFIADLDQMPGSDGFAVTLHDDTGLPGTTLDSVNVPASDVIEGAWMRVPLSSPDTILSGGVFVGWYQGGANVGLGTEGTFPISNRSYEILSGQWAPYRSVTVADPLLGIHTKTTCPPVSVDNAVEAGISLEANPNPTNGLTMIEFELPAIGNAELTISNMFGQTIFSEVRTDLAAGKHSLNFDTNGLAAGVYFINMTHGNEKVTQKLVVNR